ncbi:MAG: hypothetical protein C4289_12605, partial [Chloroflexota bacterium]
VDGTPNELPAADFAAWLVGSEHLRWAGSQGHILPALMKVAQEVFMPPSSDSRPRNQQAFVRAAQYAPPIIPHPEYTTLSRAYNTAVAEWLGGQVAGGSGAPESTARHAGDPGRVEPEESLRALH